MASFNTMRSASAATPLIAQYACEICRERKVRCDRALPKCRRCNRLNQPCNYNQAHQRRTRDEQLRQLQERLAKTEAQLALNTPAPPPPVPSQPSSEGTEPALSIKSTRTPDFFTPNTCSQQNSQYQLPETTNPQSQPASALGNTVTHTPMDLDNIREMSTASDMANGSSFLDPDLFTSFTDVADSNMTFAWTNQPLTALEPLDHVLLNRPHSAPQSGSKDELSPTDLNLLHNHFFESVYFSFPFVNRDRFVAESTENNNPATNALIYAVALAGCAHSPQNVAQQSTCYTLSRNYAEKCEQDNHLNHLNFLQALLLIGRFEAMNRKLERSWLTLGRAAMLCKLLKLQRMDEAEHCQGSQNEEAQGGLQLVLPHTDNPVLLEERRRTFWGLYILQSYVRTRTGWPCQLGDTQSFRINLPSPGLLRSNLEPIKMPSLLDFSTENSPEISSYAGCVLMVELALCCFDNGQQRDTAGFWDNYCGLVKKTDNLFNILKHHLNATSIREDPVAFSLYLNLRAIEIFSHESAIIKSEDQGLPPLMIAGSQRRATAAAFQICSAVGLNLPSPRKKERDIIMLQAIFIAWPLTMALKALYRELVKGGICETVNGVVASSRLLFAALDHIEESDGYWHNSVTHVGARLQEWDEKNSFESIAL